MNGPNTEHTFLAFEPDGSFWVGDPGNYRDQHFAGADEEHILRCLGAALIMRWNTLQTELQRELFDDAGSMGALLDTATLRAQIARFLRKHTNGHDEMARHRRSPRMRPTVPE
jgi:hypothetical protein